MLKSAGGSGSSPAFQSGTNSGVAYGYTTVSGARSISATGSFISPADLRYTYSSAAPANDGTIRYEGAVFYTTASPSTSVDTHLGSYSGITGITYSASSTTLQQLVGGNFQAIREGGAGSTNLVSGVVGAGVMGGSTAGIANGDGCVGGHFTAYQKAYSGQLTFTPHEGILCCGVVGESYVNNSYTVTGRAGGVAGQVVADTIVSEGYGLWSEVTSKGGTMALVGNAYGLYVKDISGAKNLSAAIYTNAGTVRFGGNLTLGSGIVGNVAVTALDTPVIQAVQYGWYDEYSQTGAASTKTYTYKVVALCANGVTAASAAVSTTQGYDDLSVLGQNNRITWNPVEGATGGYDIYRTVAGGATTNTTGKIGHVSDAYVRIYNGSNGMTPTIPAFVDSGQAGDASSPPTANTSGNITAVGSILSSGATSGIGYKTGAGGTVTQATSKATGVTLNTMCGTITLNGAALAANTGVSFTWTNSGLATGDVVVFSHDSVGTIGAYNVNAVCSSGSATVTVRNITGGSLSEAIVLRFIVVKAVTA